MQKGGPAYEDQAGAPLSLIGGSVTGILQADGCAIPPSETTGGLEGNESLDHEFMIHVNHFKVPKLFQCLLQTCGFRTINGGGIV